jgi:hypothetical protein
MSIAHFRENCKAALGRVPRDVLVVSILILASTLSFGLGYLSGRDAGQGRTISISPFFEGTTEPTGAKGEVVASRNGSKYYLKECPGIDRISESNQVWFPSAEAAEAQGYAKASNCE